LQLPEEITNYQQQFYVGTHVKTYDGNDHPQTRVAPKIKSAKTNHCLNSNEQEDSNEFDSISNGVFSKINPNDLTDLKKG